MKLDILTVGGIALGVILLLWAIMIGGTIGMFINIPGILITVGGSFSALLIRFKIDQMKMVVNITKNVFTSGTDDMGEIISSFGDLSQKARREGLLSLEDDIEGMTDPFQRTALQMVVDGLEPELIRDIMETEIFSLESRHKLGQEVYRSWGAYAPAFGMIGTLIGLIQMLAHLDDVAAIGPGMAVALLTTLYGALLANLVFIPMAGKLATRSEAEVALKQAIVEGVLAIQAGTNPRILQEKLKAFLSPREKAALDAKEGVQSGSGGKEVVTDNV